MCSQKERRMKPTHSMVLVVCCALAAFVTMTAVHAGIDGIAFPREYAKGVMYTSHDLADVKEYREFYITPAALEAVHQINLFQAAQ
jgi:hypothetical protein